ncbi:MAG TPA: 50S ribosomal protein L29 [Bacteroidetes bacterium]|nr:50S ribosomal protein L29 [Bacteroidota bacterium]
MGRITDELRELSLDELRARLADAEEELANLRFQLGSSQLESPIRVRYARREVARITTLIREMEAAAVHGAGEAKAEER